MTTSKLTKGFSKETALHHQRTRAAHAEERAQDYVETIAHLQETQGRARAMDLARHLGVTHVTVIRILKRLEREGLVIRSPYQPISLTRKGQKIALEVRSRHTTVINFLRVLGVSETTAKIDAEGIEHHVSKETLAAFERFLNRPHK